MNGTPQQDTCIYCGRTIYQVYAQNVNKYGDVLGDYGWRWCIDPLMWDPLRLYRCERSFPYLLGSDASASRSAVWHEPKSAAAGDAALVTTTFKVCLPARAQFVISGMIKN
jgi:hypothetical protein